MATASPSLRLTGFSWSASLREAAVLLLVSLVAATGWWLRAEDRLPLRAEAAVYELELEAPLLTIEEALTEYDTGNALFVDTRVDPAESIPGAFFVREETFDDDLLANFDFLFPEDQLILFGNGNLTAASNIAGRLQERGFAKVTILKGGLAAWRKAGGEVSDMTEEATP